MANIASISVSLIAKTKPFVKGLQKAARRAKGFVKSVAKMALKVSGLALAGGAVVAAFQFGKSLKDLDRIAKLSKSTGLSTKQLQVLKVVADRGGVSLEQMAKSSLKLSGFAFDALIGKTEDARRIFRALGINSKELNAGMKNSGVLLELVVTKWNALEDGTMKSAIAQKLFGARMASVVAAFPEGAKGIAAVTKEMEELGLIVSPERLSNIEEFNDRMDDITRVFKGFSDALTGGAAGKGKEFLDSIFAKLKGFIQEQGGLQNFADTTLANIAEKFRAIMVEVRAFIEGVKQVVELGKSVAAFFGFDGMPKITPGVDRINFTKAELSDPQIKLLIKRTEEQTEVLTGLILGGFA